jgi:hypothetical protein
MASRSGIARLAAVCIRKLPNFVGCRSRVQIGRKIFEAGCANNRPLNENRFAMSPLLPQATSVLRESEQINADEQT